MCIILNSILQYKEVKGNKKGILKSFSNNMVHCQWFQFILNYWWIYIKRTFIQVHWIGLKEYKSICRKECLVKLDYIRKKFLELNIILNVSRYNIIYRTNKDIL